MKRTAEREQVVLNAIRDGSTLRAAAAYAGIDESTLWRWAKQSATFATALTRAEAESEVALVAFIRQAAHEDWRAAAHLLERRWPDTWGKRDRVEITLRREAERLASELGLDVNEVLAEAERMLSSA